jgi:hypothetical protein
MCVFAIERHPSAGVLCVSLSLQTGKSYTLDHAVPTAVAEAVRLQGAESRRADMVLLRLNGGDLIRTVGISIVVGSNTSFLSAGTERA